MESCLLQVMQGGWHSWYMMVYVGMFSRDVKCAKSKRCGSSFLEVRCMDLGEDLVHPWFARFCKHNSPPARWGLLDFIRAVLLLLRLLRLLCRLLLRLLTCRLLLAVQIPVGTAGPQPRLPGRSGHCRTSTATSRSQWALPDLNRDFQIAVGTAGPQREECQKRCQIECQKICQIECQKECQKICQTECQKICQKECQKICQIECQKICQIECQKIC